jgi:hypothetical protein
MPKPFSIQGVCGPPSKTQTAFTARTGPVCSHEPHLGEGPCGCRAHTRCGPVGRRFVLRLIALIIGRQAVAKVLPCFLLDR